MIPQIPQGNAGVQVDFGGTGGVVLVVREGREQRIENLDAVGAELLRLIREGRVAREYALVTHVVEATSMTALISSSGESSFVASAEADLTAGLLDLANLSGGLTRVSSSNLEVELVAQAHATPLCKLSGFKRRGWYRGTPRVMPLGFDSEDDPGSLDELLLGDRRGGGLNNSRSLLTAYIPTSPRPTANRYVVGLQLRRRDATSASKRWCPVNKDHSKLTAARPCIRTRGSGHSLTPAIGQRGVRRDGLAHCRQTLTLGDPTNAPSCGKPLSLACRQTRSTSRLPRLVDGGSAGRGRSDGRDPAGPSGRKATRTATTSHDPVPGGAQRPEWTRPTSTSTPRTGRRQCRACWADGRPPPREGPRPRGRRARGERARGARG